MRARLTLSSILLSLILFSVMPVADCPALTTGEVVRGIEERYGCVWSLKADFVQETTTRMLGQTRVTKARGRVYLQRPGLMRVEYTTPPKNVWVSDGKTLWFYQPRDKQVNVGRVDLERGGFFLGFLMGESDLAEDFEIHGWDREVETWHGAYRSELVPRKPQAMMDRLVLLVDRKTGYVDQAEVYDAYGNLTRTLLKRVRVNRKLPADLFTFVVPPGIEVIEGFPGSQD